MNGRIEVSEKLLSRLQNSLKRAIITWRFEDAPKEFQDLSTNGGDEDWVILIPAELTYTEEVGSRYYGWEYVFERFDSCDEPDRFILEDGSIVSRMRQRNFRIFLQMEEMKIG